MKAEKKWLRLYEREQKLHELVRQVRAERDAIKGEVLSTLGIWGARDEAVALALRPAAIDVSRIQVRKPDETYRNVT